MIKADYCVAPVQSCCSCPRGGGVGGLTVVMGNFKCSLEKKLGGSIHVSLSVHVYAV